MSCADKHKTIAMIYSQYIYALSKQAAWFGKASGGRKVGTAGGEAPTKILRTRPLLWLKTHLPNPFQFLKNRSLTSAQKTNLDPIS